MGLFGYKNNNKEFIAIESFCKQIDSLFSLDKFISRKDYISFYNETIDIYKELVLMEEKSILKEWCKKNDIDYKLLKKYFDKFVGTEELVKEHNTKFIEKHLKIDKTYLDEILLKDDPNIILDEEQRKVVLSDEDYTLVIAGAGAGKTTTIEAKVKYLVEKQNVDADKILIVSFTRKATEELKERFKRLELDVNIATFHSIGNTIIKENEPARHRIVSTGYMYDKIREYLTTKLDDEYFIKKILLFFASYLNMPFDETNTSLLFKSLKDDNITTLKSDLETLINDYQKEQTKNRITINNERVRSIDECRIANFLYINGVDYIYEPVYRYGFKDTIKPYCPDFAIKQDGSIIYLEHFGLSQDGKNNRFNEKELEEYKCHVNDKIKLHREHGTKLIYTFSKYNDGRDLIEHLKEELQKVNIKLDTKSNIDIYRRIVKTAEDKYFSKFITLVCNFISKFKVNNFTMAKFDEWKINVKDERTKLFIDICYQCYLAYTKALKDYNAIDFEDMINNAANILDKRIKENDLLPYEYILVDEYQDISLQRFDLCEKLSKASNAKIIAVGDDWQSIFRFSGAKIDLFTKFEEKMGYANILKITKTYRNSQELIDIAGGFVMANDEQIKKSLKSNKTIKDPVILMSYNDSYEKDENDKGPFYRLGEAIENSLDHIVSVNGEEKSILLIGRFGFDGKSLSKLDDFFYMNGNKIKSKKYPNLNIDFLTAHSSKGLGYDNVIVINGKDDIMGFPSKIEDDPVMKLVIKDDEDIDYAEERRLFYVALTRTKNRVYLITPQYRPSKFILEIKDQFTNVILKGVELNPNEENDFRRKCPNCGYPLQRRKSNFKFMTGAKTLWICSNDPEICGFMTNDLKGGYLSISKCPDCEDGYLIIKPIRNKEGQDTGNRMLGCTNYKKDGTGCKGYLMPYNYTQDKSKLAVAFYDGNMTLDKMIFMGYPIRELVTLIIESIKLVESKYPKFKFNFSSLKDFLSGKESKTIVSFKLNEVRNFGMIKQEYHKRIEPLLNELVKEEILKIDKDNYNAISFINNNIDDEMLKIIFSNLVK